MTTPAQGSGRPSAIHLRLAFAALLAAASLPVAAAEAPRDPLDLSPPLMAPLADAGLRNPLSLPGRTVLFARDVRAIFDDAAVAGGIASEATAAAPTEGRIRGMLRRALSLLGTPYRWGGTTPENGFDCSGLVGYVFRNNLGIELPRISRDMAKVGELIRDRDALVEGDLVFFSRAGKHVDHVGIYIGNGQFLHAPRTGKDVEIATLASGYWAQKFLQARRVAAQ
ncbi:MAG: C40 family peptidase [Lysobacteraceae bacterium]